MGYFSYICNGCHKNIRFDGVHGEWCVLQHVRQSKLIGQVEGEYDGCGRIVGNSVFRNPNPENPNGQEEIGHSELMLDSRRELRAFAMSGISAWHKKCYYEAPSEKRNRLLISKSDPYQGYGDSLRAAFVESRDEGANSIGIEFFDLLNNTSIRSIKKFYGRRGFFFLQDHEKPFSDGEMLEQGESGLYEVHNASYFLVQRLWQGETSYELHLASFLINETGNKKLWELLSLVHSITT
ncbi:hypothetical protein M5X11_12735 [Paenibacillus alginolyticus]|uniref:hypothetical protein n=1 Tax=Paenibacillus alginolyticus TaxID=59839 RepID=UPI0003F4AF3B|nr:hypothetical protein [Paenibacillus alginolyticus]MCY9665821.1 hypothetical protein [Paenibacillus alginolyticus]